MARKPLVGTVARNVLEFGVGALNIDACRIGMSDEDREKIESATWVARGLERKAYGDYATDGTDQPMQAHAAGRWPANVVLDVEAARLLDEQSGEATSRSGGRSTRGATSTWDRQDRGMFDEGRDVPRTGHDDRGGASRFFLNVSADEARFRYVPKSSRAERNAGLDGLPERMAQSGMGGSMPVDDQGRERDRFKAIQQNVHPTVKPVTLMRWLVRLVTPPGGTVLDPFTGSGSTGVAAVLEGVEFVGIEQDAEYVEIARRRIAHAEEQAQVEAARPVQLGFEEAG